MVQAYGTHLVSEAQVEIIKIDGYGGSVSPGVRISPLRGVLKSKAEGRAAAIKRRREIYGTNALGGALEGVAKRLCATFPPCVAARRGVCVAGYWPLNQEIDVRPLLNRLRARGCLIALPVVVGPGLPLAFRIWRPGAKLVAGPYGTRHPGPGAATVVPDIILVPLLAFDRAGFRLGYGGGYYDRTLAGLRRKRRVVAFGVAFSGQEVARVPRDRFDQPLEGVVTERGSFRAMHFAFGPSGSRNLKLGSRIR